MSLKERVHDALKDAMRARDSLRLDAIRALRGEIIKAEKTGTDQEVDDADIIRLAKSLIKQRCDAVEQFRAAKRMDLVEKDEGQIAVLQEFLPAALSENELSAMIDEVIKATGANTARDMGSVMKGIMAAAAERGVDVDGKTASSLVRERLSN